MAVIREIREKIDSWLAGGGERSPAELARRSGLPYSTVRRAVQGESVPTYANLANILSVVLPESEAGSLPSLLKAQFPQASSVIDTFLGKGVVSDQQRLALNGLIDCEPLCSVVYALVDCQQGTSLNDIKAEYGRAGARSLNLLEEAGLVEMVGGMYRTVSEAKVNFTVNTFKNTVLAHVQSLNAENIEKSQAHGSIQWGGISMEAYKLAIEKHEKCMSEIGKIVDSNPGTIPAYFLSLANSYLNVEETVKKGGLK